MARSRNIKPGFFKNEGLAECTPLSRILFAGLWCLADRKGRLEDRPKRIRAEILPYDDGSVDAMLDELHKSGFIMRYTIDGKAFIQVLNFSKHQNPHCKEQDSLIPAPDLHGARTVQERDDHQKSTEQAGLIPDSLNRIPDSLNPVPLSDDNGCAQAKPEHVPACPQQRILALYAESLPELAQPRTWTGQREANLRSRWRWVMTAKRQDGERYATTDDEGLEYFQRLFGYVRESDFLMGRSGKWQCDLPWLMKAENFAKVIDGKYDNRDAA